MLLKLDAFKAKSVASSQNLGHVLISKLFSDIPPASSDVSRMISLCVVSSSRLTHTSVRHSARRLTCLFASICGFEVTRHAYIKRLVRLLLLSGLCALHWAVYVLALFFFLSLSPLSSSFAVLSHVRHPRWLPSPPRLSLLFIRLLLLLCDGGSCCLLINIF